LTLPFTYDGFGNLTDKTPNTGSPPALHVTVNPATNQITGYAYDANGNLTNIPSQMGLTYNKENRIATVLPVSDGTETYRSGSPSTPHMSFTIKSPISELCASA
jgi:YD repeat-containing protein